MNSCLTCCFSLENLFVLNQHRSFVIVSLSLSHRSGLLFSIRRRRYKRVLSLSLLLRLNFSRFTYTSDLLHHHPFDFFFSFCSLYVVEMGGVSSTITQATRASTDELFTSQYIRCIDVRHPVCCRLFAHTVKSPKETRRFFPISDTNCRSTT